MKPIIKITRMNKTEARYARELDAKQHTGEIIGYVFEAVKFRLANNTWYTPDFYVIHDDYFEVVEIKGFLRDDAAVKFKTVAEMYPWLKWRMISWKKDGWHTIYER